MEQSEVNQIVLGAITASGPCDQENSDAWVASVHDMAARIATMCTPTSSVSKLVQSVANSKVFTGTVLGITKESSSTRGVVTLKTRPSKFHPDGTEQARTERTDSAVGLAMARRIRSLVGHQVVLWVEVEIISDGGAKVRVIRWVEDLGEAPATSHTDPDDDDTSNEHV